MHACLRGPNNLFILHQIINRTDFPFLADEITERHPKEVSHRDGSFEYPQHMFWLRNKKNNFLVHTLN